jgi:hypothetical protein
MFGFGKKNAAIDAFADTLIADLVTRFPAAKEKELGGNRAKPARQLGKAASEMDYGVTVFTAEHKVGIYGKARLLNRVQWQLRDRGYSRDFIETTVAELTRLIARSKARQ